MKKTIFFIILFIGCLFPAKAQKSKVISVFQLIETGKYSEAKDAIEEAIKEDNTKTWYRTWYARGFLLQTAYQKGMKENDKDKYELYPDQLFEAFRSYQKAINLDTRNRIDDQLAPLYVQLANEFQKMGEKQYKNKHFKEAFRAFEQALEIINSPVLSLKTDQGLVYNTALAAYESREWDKAADYLKNLHKDAYSSNASFLLYRIYLQKQDTAYAIKVLTESIDKYNDNQNMVLLLADLLYQQDSIEKAVSVLEKASGKDSSNYIYPYTGGLIRQKNQQYQQAIKAYREALELAPEESKIYAGIAICYYNIGVDIDEKARRIVNNHAYHKEKARSAEAFRSAVEWYEKACEKDPQNEEINE
ncbi:MAG TPA: tetratricopeptide repeat protein, partial [Bacteroidales bacterium]|nr:tetratricopeptide repeat protein [Bacteroidales bacterium]